MLLAENEKGRLASDVFPMFKPFSKVLMRIARKKLHKTIIRKNKTNLIMNEKPR